MKNDFAIFILTHGRPNKQKTITTLQRQGYTGKYYLIIDDEDPTIDEYQKKYSDKIIIFSKSKAIKETDTIDNFDDNRAVVFARNESFNIAKHLGLKYFLVLDDDYTSFRFRFNSQLQYSLGLIQNLDSVFSAILDFYIKSGALTMSLSQGGDFIGGVIGNAAKKIYLKRKAMNSFFCSVDRPFKFYGRTNEDTTMYCLLGSRGQLIFQINQCTLDQLETQSNSGGLTDIYLKYGTYVKSSYTLIACPSFVKIYLMSGNGVDKNKRFHHKINWSCAVPRIVSQDLMKK